MSAGIHQIIDHQIRRWEMEAEARRQEVRENPEASPVIRPCITVARMLGAGGGEIARRLVQLLGYRTLDREIMEVLLQEGRFRVQILETLDDRDRSSLELWVEGLLRGSMRDKGDYLRALLQVLGPIAVHGHAIIIGRGANFIVGSDRALHVRIVAPAEVRAAEIQRRQQTPREQAEEAVRQSDHERAAFILHHFKRNIDDPLAYDLILQSDRLGLEGAAQLIHRALHQKFGTDPKYRI